MKYQISIRFSYTDHKEVLVKYQNKLHSVIPNVSSDFANSSKHENLMLYAAVCTDTVCSDAVRTAAENNINLRAVSNTRRRAILEVLLADSS